MIFVDSSVWIDYFNGAITSQTDRLDHLLKTEIIATGDLIFTEVLQGFRSEKHFNAAQQLLGSLIFFDMLGKEIALKSTQNYRFLRQQGITIRKTIDIMIGTFCIENDLILLHSDQDFAPMQKLLKLKTDA